MQDEVQAERCVLFCGLRIAKRKDMIPMYRYKLRIYKVSGISKGNLDHEESFENKDEMDKRYNELFMYENYSLNPTAWEKVDGEWKRLAEH